MKISILLLTFFCFCKLLNAKDSANERTPKFLFNVVQFKNTVCSSQSGERRGTCYTASECNSRSGTASGTCASGFGVCCLFLATSGTVSENCTYLRNEGFPSALTDATQAPSFTINKCSNDVCAVRLDFESFTILGPGNTDENINTIACQDTLTITTQSPVAYPVICGQNRGQHVYVELGPGATGTATLNFAFNGAGSRTFEIKTSQIPCSASYRNPVDCFQYFTGTSGRFTTFNFLDTDGIHLPDQRYTSCIRQEVGYCCVEYQECSDPNSFSLRVQGNAGNNANVLFKGRVDRTCDLSDYTIINGASNVCTDENGAGQQVSRVCGSVLTASNQGSGKANSNAICDCTEPFNLGIVTDAGPDLADGAVNTRQSRGVCLEWRQIPCSN